MTLTTSSHSTRVRSADTRRRAGFTLIELLVVIAIIAVLAALTGAAIQMTMVRQRNLNTKGDVNKLQQSLDVEYSRVVKKCADDRVATRIPAGVLSYCDGDPNRAQAVWTALNLYRQFPETFNEANNTITLTDPSTGTVLYRLPPMQTFASVQGQNLQSGMPPNNPNEESGALLFIILTQKSAAGGGAMAVSGDDLNLQRVVAFPTSTGGSVSLPTFKDSWGNTIGFRRWLGTNWWGTNPVPVSPPTNWWVSHSLTDPGAIQGAPYLGSVNQFNNNNNDPLDPRNLVLGWSNTAKQAQLISTPSGPAPIPLFFAGSPNHSPNRIPNVYSPGNLNAKPPTPIFGYQAKQYGN